MATKKQTEAEKIAEQERLIEVLKFTPRTYHVQMWGYGGEVIMGTVDRKIFDYFKTRRLDVSDFAWNSDYAEDNDIPEEMWPFTPGSWYDCDDMAHAHGTSRNAGTLQVSDENGDTVYEASLEGMDGYSDDSAELSCGDEVWIGMKPAGTVVFIGRSNEKGTFFEGEIELKEPFDITKVTLNYDEIDGEELVTGIEYDGETIDNNGGSTDGKSSDFGFYLVKDSNSWEKYTTMDDIEYTMTDWFPKKVKPVHVGVYMIKSAGKNSWEHRGLWTGTRWVNTWTLEAEFDTVDELKIKEWQGISYNPDEHDLREELDNIILEMEPA